MQARAEESGVTAAPEREGASAVRKWPRDTIIEISAADVEDGLDRLGIDEHGLDRVDRRVLEILLANGDQAVGVKTLAVSVGEEERTIEDVYEPWLIREGLVLKTSRGRRATGKAASLYSHFG